MQTQLFGEKLTLATVFPTQPAPTTAALEATQERNDQEWSDIVLEIEEKQERIIKLKKEIGDDEEALLNAEEDEIDMEPDEGEEVIFDAVTPQLEADLEYTQAENEEEIRAIEQEITELEGQLA